MTLSRRAALVALVALPVACSSPNPTLYVLAPVSGTPRKGAPRTVALRAIAIPHYLERSQIVRSSEGYRMEVLSNEWWGDPLDTMISRILVQELNQRLPGSAVYADNGAISTRPDATVEINLQRLDLDSQGELLLSAQVAVDGRFSHGSARGRDHASLGGGHEQRERPIGRHCRGHAGATSSVPATVSQPGKPCDILA
jgi:uncharacterized lipoprotein YmbA